MSSKTTDIANEIMEVLRQKAINDPDDYVNPNFLLDLTDLLKVYYDLADEQVHEYILSMFEL